MAIRKTTMKELMKLKKWFEAEMAQNLALYGHDSYEYECSRSDLSSVLGEIERRRTKK